MNDKREMIESNAEDNAPSIRRQCALIGLNRSSWYLQCPVMGESPENLALMRIDELYTAHPFYGSRKLVAVLEREEHTVNRKRVHPQHKVYPYVLRGLAVVCPGQVYWTDITYIRVGRGVAYLVAVIDWYSRKVLSWRLSNTMDVDFCVKALERH